MSSKFFSFLFLFNYIYFFSNGQKNLYVSTNGLATNSGSITSPVRTLHQALELISNMSLDYPEDIVIEIKGGKYTLSHPLIINDELGKYFKSLTIKPQNEYDSVILSGGVNIQNWENHAENILKARIEGNDFRQVYLGEQKAIRSRDPNSCSYNKLKWDGSMQRYKLLDEPVTFINDLSNPVEFHVQRLWAHQIARLNKIIEQDGAGFVEVFHQDNWFADRNYLNRGDFQYFHFENSYSFLDQNNEWFLDSNGGYLYLYSDTLVNYNDIIVPFLENLLIIRGTPDNPISNIIIENLTFKHTNWKYPTEHGLYVTQSNWLYNEAPENIGKEGAVFVENAYAIQINECVFEKIGGSGLVFNNGVHNSRITGNIFKNISSNGISIDWNRSVTDSLQKDYCSNILIDNNLITKVGQDYMSASGICVGMGKNITIEHNFLFDMPYTGISVGFGHTLGKTILGNNIIRYNFIDKVMNSLCDGAAIYTLSSQPGTKIYENVIQNINKSPWGGIYPVIGIYLDEGSNYISVFGNIVRNVEKNIHDNSRGGDSNDYKAPFISDKMVNFAGLKREYMTHYNHITELTCDQSTVSHTNKMIKVDLRLFPNPAQNFIQINEPNVLNASYLEWKIVNSQGIEFLSGKLNKTNYLPFILNISSLKKGIYILNINFDEYYGESVFIVH